MSAPKKLDGQTETQVVAMIARGDTHQQIVDWLDTEKSISMSIANIGVIKKRNQEGINFMRGEQIKHETTMATTILEKSRRLINHRLDQALTLDESLAKLKARFDDGEITDKEYYHEVDIELRNRLSPAELNALAKESFNQSQLEANKPTSITESPAQAKANLETLLHAIATGDDQGILKAIFPDA